MTFDRLSYIDALTEAGIAEPQARAHAQALRVALQDTVATKADLAELATATKADFALAKADIAGLAAATKADIAGLAAATKADIAEMAAQMTAMERRLEAKIVKVGRKIDVTARALVIKGAGGVALLASLMIGLKLLG